MAITTYAELQTSVASWLNRTDLTAQVPDFITLAEAKINADISGMRSMETKTNLSTVASSRTVTLPTDMLEMKRLQISSTYNTVLKYLAPDEFSADYSDNATGTPVVFTVVGGLIELAPIPDAVYTLELSYYQKVPSLSASNTTNWLLTAWPNVYLWASLMAAQPFLLNDPRVGTFAKLYEDAIESIMGVDWFNGSTMRVKAK